MLLIRRNACHRAGEQRAITNRIRTPYEADGDGLTKYVGTNCWRIMGHAGRGFRKDKAMPRQPQPELTEVTQHGGQRGDGRRACFFAEEHYRYYLTRSRRAAYREPFRDTLAKIALLRFGCTSSNSMRWVSPACGGRSKPCSDVARGFGLRTDLHHFTRTGAAWLVRTRDKESIHPLRIVSTRSGRPSRPDF